MKRTKKMPYIIFFSILSCCLISSVSMATTKKGHYYKYNVVTDFNANGADKQDDYRAIQDALNTARTRSSREYTKVIIPKGTYYISKSLRMFSNTTIHLNDGAVIKRMSTNVNMLKNNALDATMGLETKTGKYNVAKNLVIEGGTWDGGNFSSGNGSNNFYFGHCSNLIIRNTTIKNNYNSHLIELAGVNNALISNCKLSGYKYKGNNNNNEAIQVEVCAYGIDDHDWSPGWYKDNTPCKNITITGCTITDYPRAIGQPHGLPGIYTTGLKITYNTIKNMYAQKDSKSKKEYSDAIIFFYSKNAVIENNTITNARNGITLSNTTGAVVQNNKISSINYCGMYLTNHTNASKCTNNIFTNCNRNIYTLNESSYQK